MMREYAWLFSLIRYLHLYNLEIDIGKQSWKLLNYFLLIILKHWINVAIETPPFFAGFGWRHMTPPVFVYRRPIFTTILDSLKSTQEYKFILYFFYTLLQYEYYWIPTPINSMLCHVTSEFVLDQWGACSKFEFPSLILFFLYNICGFVN